MAPAAKPPMMPAATAPPRACAGCVGVTSAAAPKVAAAATAIKLLLNFVMRTSWIRVQSVSPFNARDHGFLRLISQRQLCREAGCSDFGTEQDVNGVLGTRARASRAIKFS